MRLPFHNLPEESRAFHSAFTLIELILVMAILTIAVSITAPALANFFRGRTLDSEARLLLSLTRQGQSRAVSEGIPIELWINTAQGTFGLEAEPGYDEKDPKAASFTLDSDLHITTVNGTSSGSSSSVGGAGSLGGSSVIANASVKPVRSNHPELPKIRFLPDGTLDDSSPQMLRLTGRDGTSMWVAQSRGRLNYEIRSHGN